jgi:hypothetical protein
VAIAIKPAFTPGPLHMLFLLLSIVNFFKPDLWMTHLSLHQISVQMQLLGENSLIIPAHGVPFSATPRSASFSSQHLSPLGLSTLFIYLWLGILIKSFFFCDTGVWTQGLTLARQVLCHLNHSASPFLFCISSRWGFTNYLPGLASNCDSPDLYLPRS